MKKKAFDLLTLGEILLRLSPPDNERIVRGETFQKQVGGAELNVASGVSLLGLRSGIISRIPDSSIGMFAKNKIRFCGVSDDYLVYDTGKDARLGVYYYENGAYPRKPGVVYVPLLHKPDLCKVLLTISSTYELPKFLLKIRKTCPSPKALPPLNLP